MTIHEARELKAILNQGIKAQLMRGDRDIQDCFKISIEGIHRVNDKIDQMVEK